MNKVMSTLGTIALAGSLTLASPMAAMATQACVPEDAWTEVVSEAVPAVEAVEEVSHTVDYPAVEEDSYVYHQRYSWTGGLLLEAPSEVPPSDNWNANTTNYKPGKIVGVPYKQGNGNNTSWFFWLSEVVVIQEATPAWSEQVIDISAIPAVPAVPAVTIEHPAVICDPVEEPVVEEPVVEEPVVEEPVVEEPAVEEPVVEEPVVEEPVEEEPVVVTPTTKTVITTPSENVEKLAYTGESPNYTPLIGGSILGAGVLLTAAGAFLRRRFSI